VWDADPKACALGYILLPAGRAVVLFLRITDNWVELAVRFLCGTHDVRGLKDRISREILSGLEAAKIGIASGTYEIVGVPPIRVEGLGSQRKTA
jgi:hypothetical protein